MYTSATTPPTEEANQPLDWKQELTSSNSVFHISPFLILNHNTISPLYSFNPSMGHSVASSSSHHTLPQANLGHHPSESELGSSEDLEGDL